ncbi:MAG: DUF2007 domain-containing protein [Dehalococcoidia bacterium]|jgi:hypothetical protein|nr:DUF2007 domain-containing protein [Dehalococcoidia bacterium]|tara:strand:- start:399 stop:644 length:246 start_codon:yes stop_codon:yes gene_type:complete
MSWEVFATAPDQLIAESWCGLLETAGIECKLQPGDAVGFMGVSVFPVRLMARTEDIERARTVLDSYIAEDEQPPDSGQAPE